MTEEKNFNSKAEKYLTYALEHLVIVSDKNEKPYVYVKGQKNPIAYPLMSQWTKKFLRKAAQGRGELLRNDDLAEIFDHLQAHAAVIDHSTELFFRVGKNPKGNREIDLGCPNRTRVRLRDGQFELVDDSDVLFYRSDSMQPLPTPKPDGDWRALLPLLNMQEIQKHLLLSFMTYVLAHPKGTVAYPLLVIKGGMGVGKSMLSRVVLRTLLDNNSAGVQLFPKDIRDMLISSMHQYVLIYDNVRELSKDWSDALCIMSTSGTLARRKLYTDAEESTLKAHAPVVLNGIHNFITEPDLASRCVLIQLLPIKDGERRDETELVKDFMARAPGIVGGLFQLTAQVLARMPEVKDFQQSRLMDFSRWIAAMELALGQEPGSLQAAYAKNVSSTMFETLQEDALGLAVLQFITIHPEHHWSGTPTELLEALDRIAPPRVVNQSSKWPQTAISLSKRLQRLATTLLSQGVEIQARHSTRRVIELTYTPPKPANHSTNPTDPTKTPSPFKPK